MGEVIQFRPKTKSGKHLYAQAQIERELLLPAAAAQSPAGKSSRANQPDVPPGVKSNAGFPVNGIAIVLGAVLIYVLMISHVVGQPHYSARANLMPSVFVQN